MSSRVTVALGLIVGAVLVIAAAAAIILVGPRQAGRVPSPPPPPSAELSPSASPSAVVSGSPSGGASGSPSGSASASASASAAPPASTGAAASSAPSPTVAAAAFHVGQQAPSLRLPQVGGGTADLEALRGRPVWVYFMATWCPSCQDEFPLMNGFAARYSHDGLVVLAVDVRENEAAAGAFATRMSAAFPVSLDADGSAATRWGVVGLPVHFWIDAQGIVRDGALGGIGGDEMAAGLGTIMPGVAVSP